jgi:hypothetical protein
MRLSHSRLRGSQPIANNASPLTASAVAGESGPARRSQHGATRTVWHHARALRASSFRRYATIATNAMQATPMAAGNKTVVIE